MNDHSQRPQVNNHDVINLAKRLHIEIKQRNMKTKVFVKIIKASDHENHARVINTKIVATRRQKVAIKLKNVKRKNIQFRFLFGERFDSDLVRQGNKCMGSFTKATKTKRENLRLATPSLTFCANGETFESARRIPLIYR